MLKRMMNAKLSTAFNRRATFAREVKHSHVVVKRCLAKIRNRWCVSGAWKTGDAGRARGLRSGENARSPRPNVS